MKKSKIKILNIKLELENLSNYMPDDPLSFIILGLSAISKGQEISLFQVDEIFRVLKKRVDDLIFDNRFQYTINYLNESVSDSKHISANQCVSASKDEIHFNVYYKFGFKGAVDLMTVYDVFDQF